MNIEMGLDRVLSIATKMIRENQDDYQRALSFPSKEIHGVT